tara:strand:+ start:257 stop:643 length:387 start_codon:yes stop_codon:yes gene_type:complete
MMETVLELTILAIEFVGASFIVISVALGLIEIVRSAIRPSNQAAPSVARLNLAQRLVLALEFLIAADILKTILTPTLEDMALLGSIIAIRTVLSLSIAYELRRDDQSRTRVSLIPGQTQPDCQNSPKK